jgi:hypothetical protein
MSDFIESSRLSHLEQIKSQLQETANHSAAACPIKGRRAKEKARGVNIMLLYTQLASITPASGKRRMLQSRIFTKSQPEIESPEQITSLKLTAISDRVSVRKQAFSDKKWGRKSRRRPHTKLPPLGSPIIPYMPKMMPMEQVVASSGSVVTLANLNKIAKTNRRAVVDSVSPLHSCTAVARCATPLPHRMDMHASGLESLLSSASQPIKPRLSIGQSKLRSATAPNRFQHLQSRAMPKTGL